MKIKIWGGIILVGILGFGGMAQAYNLDAIEDTYMLPGVFAGHRGAQFPYGRTEELKLGGDISATVYMRFDISMFEEVPSDHIYMAKLRLFIEHAWKGSQINIFRVGREIEKWNDEDKLIRLWKPFIQDLHLAGKMGFHINEETEIKRFQIIDITQEFKKAIKNGRKRLTLFLNIATYADKRPSMEESIKRWMKQFDKKGDWKEYIEYVNAWSDVMIASRESGRGPKIDVLIGSSPLAVKAGLLDGELSTAEITVAKFKQAMKKYTSVNNVGLQGPMGERGAKGADGSKGPIKGDNTVPIKIEMPQLPEYKKPVIPKDIFKSLFPRF